MATGKTTEVSGETTVVSLRGRNPTDLKVAELKLWLHERKKSTKGKRADLAARVAAYVREGLDEQPSCSSTSGTITDMPLYNIPTDGWKDIKSIVSKIKLNFNNSHIVTYFVNRSVDDGLPANDFKAINKSAEYLFHCGHIQSIQYCTSLNMIYIRCICLPEMRKDRVYNVCIGLKGESSDILYATCGCPAGKGPKGSCKHISALTYGISDFCKVFEQSGYKTCTDVLQTWNKPRTKRVTPIPVDELGSRRRELTKSSRKSHILFDPRPLSLRQKCPLSLEKLRCDLLVLPKESAFTTLLLPPVEKIQHDHCYTNLTSEDKPGIILQSKVVPIVCPFSEAELHSRGESIIEKLTLTEIQIEELEKTTRTQSKNPLWFEARKNRITGSKCGRILIQKNPSISLLQYCLYPKPFIYLPKPIQWGRKHEYDACREYTKHMIANGHLGLTAHRCGFFVHPLKGWLGASPDAWIHYPSSIHPDGIAEFKCPYSKADVDPCDACEDQSFYCSLINNKLQLKREHSYYHQIQLQLYVCGDKAAFCDFCIYTSKGVLVERVVPDKQWQENEAMKLDNYFLDVMLKELTYPVHKPSYYL